MVAGLEDISGGTLQIGDRVVNDLLPKDRDIAMVFQNYALYPHMTVGENIGVRAEAAQAAEAGDRHQGAKAARILGLTHGSTASRGSSPAASASAWRWVGRSSGNRRCS